MLTLCHTALSCSVLIFPCLGKVNRFYTRVRQYEYSAFTKPLTGQKKRGVGGVNAENKCHMSERVNLI